MAHEIFVDTSGFYALLVKRDGKHAEAARLPRTAGAEQRGSSPPTMFWMKLLKHADQWWSFTDCLSFRIMKERRLRDALTKDSHFAQAGFAALLK